MAALSFHPLRVTAVERAAEDATCVTVEIPAGAARNLCASCGPVRHGAPDHQRSRRTPHLFHCHGAGRRRAQAGHPDANRRPHVGRSRREFAPRRPARRRHAHGAVSHVDRSRTRQFSYVAFAAGSGITPVLSLATDILAREPRSRFTLIYGNRSISRTMFLEETLALKNRYMDRLSLHFVMSREPQQTELLNGRIDGNKVAELAQHLPEICGRG